MDKQTLEKKLKFIEDYKNASNAATGSQFDSNANVATKNIATLQCELGKKDFLELIKNYSTEEIIYNGENLDLIIDTDSDVYKGYLKCIKALKEILEYPTTKIDLLILFIGQHLELEKEDKAIVDYVAFYIKYLAMDNMYMTLSEVYEIISNSKNRVFNYIIDIVYEMNGYEPEPGSITVCNYHKSKGLEWDCVFLLGLVEYNFPDNIDQKFQGEKWYLKDKYKHNINAEIISVDWDSFDTLKSQLDKI